MILEFALAAHILASQITTDMTQHENSTVVEKESKEIGVQEYIVYCRRIMNELDSNVHSYEQCLLSKTFWTFMDSYIYDMMIDMKSLDTWAVEDEEWDRARSRFCAWLVYIKTGRSNDRGWTLRRLKEEKETLKDEFKEHCHRVRYWLWREKQDERKVLESA